MTKEQAETVFNRLDIQKSIIEGRGDWFPPSLLKQWMDAKVILDSFSTYQHTKNGYMKDGVISKYK